MTDIATHGATSRPSRAELGRLDIFIILVSVSLSILTVVNLSGRSTPILASRDVGIVLNALTFGIAGMAALAQWNHYIEEGTASAYALASAISVLSIANLGFVVVVLFGGEDRYGLSVTSPGQAPAYAWFVTWLVAAGLFATGARAGQRRWPTLPAHPRLGLGVNLAIVVGVFPVAAIMAPILPIIVLVTAKGPAGAGVAGYTISASPVYVLANLVVASILFIAAWRYRSSFILHGARRDAFLTLALVVGGVLAGRVRDRSLPVRRRHLAWRHPARGVLPVPRRGIPG